MKRFLTLAGLALYGFVLVAAPFEHHDLICHLKTPQHCTSCSSSQLGSDPHTLPSLDASHMKDAGSAAPFDQTIEGALLAVRTTGRSPPRLA
jgi:hypothetical protein